jgi:hypothetical protein
MNMCINPAINYTQIEKHLGRGYGYTQVIYMYINMFIFMNIRIYE